MNKNLLLNIAAIFTITMMIGCSKDGEDSGENGKTVQVTFDKTEYYPFDVALVQLSETVTANEYKGFVGTTEVQVQRLSESELGVALPHLPTGEYKLSLQMGDSKAEGKLKIKALPTVENPGTVIEEIKTTFASAITELEMENDPNTTLLTDLVGVFNDELTKMTDTERQQFAAYWQLHTEFHYSPEKDTKIFLTDRLARLRKAEIKYSASVVALGIAVGTFSVSAIYIYLDPTPMAKAICAVSAAAIIILFKNCDGLMDDVLNNVCIPIMDALQLKSTTNYDYIIVNGESQAFDPQIDLRSIAAEDVNAAGAVEVKNVISSTDRFITHWNSLSESINKLRSIFSFIPALAGCPQSISDIKEPYGRETVVLEDWELKLMEGNVSAQKTGNNSYKFTTTEKEDVEFSFKIKEKTLGLESKAYSALLQVEEDMSPVVGKWMHITTTQTWIEDATGERMSESMDNPGKETYTFTSDGRVLFAENRVGGYCEFTGYGVESCLSRVGVLNSYTLLSASSLVITWYGSSYGRSELVIKYYCTKVNGE